MALSGSCNTTKYSTSSSGTIGLNLSWTATQNTTNNTSTVKWTLKSNGTMSSGYYVKAGPVTCTINGTKVVNTTSRFDMKGGGSYKKTGSIVITHNADGTKSFNASVTAALYSTSVNVHTGKSVSSPNVSFTLDPINRFAPITTGDNFTNNPTRDGYPSIVYTNPAGTSHTTGLRARITWNSRANYTSWVTLNDEGGTYTFTSSTLTSANLSSMLSACPNSNTLPIEYELESTFDGTTDSRYFSAVLNVVDSNPIVQAISYLDVNSNVVDYKTHNSSIIVQSQSTLRIRAATSTAQNGATISSYVLNINGNDYTPTVSGGYAYYDFVQPSLSGTFTATMITTDSRGNSTETTASVVIQPWVAPTALFTLSRVNGFYSNTILYVSGTISSVSSTNTMTLQEQHRQVGSSTWSTAATIQNETNVTLDLSNSYAWEVQILVTDEYATTTYIATVGKGIPIMFIDKNKNSIGVNGYPDANNQIYVDGTIKSTGMITCPSMNCVDVTDQITITKSSGNWSIIEHHWHRSGNALHGYISFKGNGSSVSTAGNGFVGTVNFPSTISLAYTGHLIGYYSGTVCLAAVSSVNSGITVRVCAANCTLSASSALGISGTFVLA